MVTIRDRESRVRVEEVGRRASSTIYIKQIRQYSATMHFRFDGKEMLNTRCTFSASVSASDNIVKFGDGIVLGYLS